MLCRKWLCTTWCNRDKYQSSKRISPILPLFSVLSILSFHRFVVASKFTFLKFGNRSRHYICYCVYRCDEQAHEHAPTRVILSNSNCKTRCIISTSISNFSVYAYYQEGHFRLFWKFLLQLRCARYYQQGITVKVWSKWELKRLFPLSYVYFVKHR